MKTRFFISVFMLFATSAVATGETMNSQAYASGSGQASTSGSGFKYEYIPNSALKISNVGVKDFNTPNPASIYDVALFYDETPLAVLRRNSNLAYSSAPRPYDFDDDEEEEEDDEGEDDEEEEASYDEDEDEDEFDRGMSRQNKYDYSRSAASTSASDIFGNTDEYLFWAGVVFAAAAVGTGVVGFLQNKTYTDANNAVNEAKSSIDRLKKDIITMCTDEEGYAKDKCEEVALRMAEYPPGNETVCASGNYDTTCREGGYIYLKKQNIAANEKVRDSYNTGRIIFFSAAAVSAAISITLFVW
jgi:hypothetical protein